MRIVLVSKGFELALHNVFGSCTLNLCPLTMFLIGECSFTVIQILKLFYDNFNRSAWDKAAEKSYPRS